MSCAAKRALSSPGIAPVLATCSKKDSIFPAGANETKIFPEALPRNNHRWGTWRGPSSESPAVSK